MQLPRCEVRPEFEPGHGTASAGQLDGSVFHTHAWVERLAAVS